MKPKISIILPNYNNEKYLKEAIESVLKQTYTNFELIIVDDASTDGSLEIIRAFNDKRIKVITSEVNRHVAYASNLGIQYASGEYIAKIDSDDIWENQKLEKQIEFMENHKEYGGCFTRVNIIDGKSEDANIKYKVIFELFEKAKNQSQKDWLRFFLSEGNCLCNSSSLIRKSIFEKIDGFFNLAYVGAEDYELWVRMVIRYPIYVLDERLVRYRWEEDSENKISGLTKERVYAAINLQMMLKSYIFDYMTDEEFVEYFKEDFVNESSNTAQELECEKAQYLLKCTGDEVNFLGLQRFDHILRNPVMLDILEKNMNFTLPGFYKNLRVRNFGIPKEVEEKEAYIKRLEKEIMNSRNSIHNLETQIEEKEEYTKRLEKEIMNSRNSIHNLEMQIEMKNNEMAEFENKWKALIDSYESSNSWKITKPLRDAGLFIKKKPKK